jgi:uncharacterized protein YycO
MAAALIRHATASWAGHAVIYIGDGLIVEAVPPVTKVSPVNSRPDAIWNVDEPNLTDAARRNIVARARALEGTPYDYPAYIGFAMELLHIRNGQELETFFQDDRWRVCSADVADAYHYGAIDLEQGLQYPNLISPADLLNRIVQQSQGARNSARATVRIDALGVPHQQHFE